MYHFIILDFDFFYSPSCIRQPSTLPGGCSLSLAEERREKKDISAFPTKKQFRSRKASSKLAIGIVTPMELGECRRRDAAATPPPEYTAAVLCNPNIMQKQIDSALHSGM